MITGYILYTQNFPDPIPLLFPSSTVTSTATPAESPTLRPTREPVVFPPTWTLQPTWTNEPPRATWTPTNQFTQISKIVLPTQPARPFSINGRRSMRTGNFYLPSQTISIKWEYYGVGNEVNQIISADNYHRNILNIIENWHQNYMDRIEYQIDQALSDGDARRLEDLINQKNMHINDYNRQITAENDRYKGEIYLIGTSLKVTINRNSTNKPQTLLSIIGANHGTLSYKAIEANDYYLIIETSGDWFINVIFK